jgi:hypothetical protein
VGNFWSFVMASSPTYPAAAGCVGINKTIVPADTTTAVDIYNNSAGTSAVRIEALTICSDDTATMNVQFLRNASAVAYLIGTVRVATLSGTDGAAARINALTTIGTTAPDMIPVIEVPAGEKLQAKVLVAVTAAKTVTITGWARRYN